MKHNVEIKHRYSDAVLWSGKVEAPKDTSDSRLLGLAVIEAIKVGADLVGANLVGLKLIARASRADYEFVLWSSVLGGHIIRAGCRTFTLTEYRAHVAAEYPGSDKAEETLAILDYLEGRLNKFLEV